MPPLTAPQSEQLRNAILSAFTRDELVQMLLYDLNVHYLQVIPDGSLEVEVYNLVTWCEARERTPELLAAIAKRRPKNAAIRKIVTDLSKALDALPPRSDGT